MLTQELLDVLRRGVRLPPVLLVYLLFPTLFGLFPFLLVVFVVHVVVYFSPQRYIKDLIPTPLRGTTRGYYGQYKINEKNLLFLLIFSLFICTFAIKKNIIA